MQTIPGIDRASTVATGPLLLAGPAARDKVFILGDTIGHLLSAEQTGGAFELMLCECLPGGGPPLHTHPQSELFYVLDGAVEFTGWIDGALATRLAGQGDACFIPGGTPHTFKVRPESSARFLIFMSPCGLSDFFREAGNPVTPETLSSVMAAPPDFPRMMAAAQRAGMALGAELPADFAGAPVQFAAGQEGMVRQVLADVLREALRCDDADGGFLLMEDTQLPNVGMPLHTHAQPEVFYVLDGEFEFTTLEHGAPCSFRAGRGEAVYIPAYAPHSFRTALDVPSRVLIYFPVASATGFFHEAGIQADLQSALGQPFAPDPAQIGRVIAVAEEHGMKFMLP